MRFIRPALVGVTLTVAACSSSGSDSALSPEASETTTTTETSPTTAAATDELFPDVVGAVAIQAGDGSWDFAVTLSSPYDSPERYADSWRVRSEDGTVFGERFLTHDHANEQPFTRSQSGIEIPDNITSVIIEGRDQVSGWGGTVLELELDRS